MLSLADVSETLRDVRKESRLTQGELAERAGVTRSTVSRMENVTNNDMSLDAVLRLFEAAGYELHAVKRGHQRTLDHVLAEQRGQPRP
jgi:transcriptional regulator with XRE-family HTH domain